MSECWFRNPAYYIRELAEENQGQIAWDRGALIKRKIDPIKHAELHFGQTVDYRLLLVGEQGTAELRRGRGLHQPVAVYPTWSYEDQTAILEELVTKPVGEDESLCRVGRLSPDETPVLGQEHRVVIINLPPAGSGPARKFLRYLKELQEDYPNCIIHLHGVFSWRIAFGIGIASADVDPRVDAAKGKVVLPSGKVVKQEEAIKNPKWVSALGFKPVDLKEPRNRCLYNIRSAVWAAANFSDLFALPATGARGLARDPSDPSPEPLTGTIAVPRAPKAVGDKFVCNTCSVQSSCSYYREGAVCAVPGAEPLSLADHFKTRDSGLILDGLGQLLQTQAKRAEQGLTDEMIDGDLKPEVTKIINGLFDRGVTLAKLVDPGLRDPKLAINVGPGGVAAVLNGTPQQMMAAVVSALEARGIPRNQITPTMVENLLEALPKHGGDPHKAIEGVLAQSREAKG